MKFLPGIGVSKLSGTIGGVTAQSWRGLGVFRRKPIPTKNLTARQMFINSLMSLLSRAWRDELNQGLRTAWNQRAKNYPWVDVFGNERKMTGENLYVKQNMVLLDHGLVRQDQPVAETVPPELIDVVSTVEPASLKIVVAALPDAIVAAQTPFLDVWVAGGFTEFSLDPTPPELSVDSLALPAGRIAHRSDFRHVAYTVDVDETSVTTSLIEVGIPEFQVRNVVVIIRRYNKFGNFTAPQTFEGIVDRS